jgi:hypothetical protein
LVRWFVRWIVGSLVRSFSVAVILGKEFMRALQKTEVPFDRPFLEDLAVNFGIGFTDDPRIAQTIVANSGDDEWADD